MERTNDGNHDNGIHLANNLQQGGIRRIGQEQFLVVEQLRETEKVAVLLVDLLVVLALWVGTNRRIAEYRYAQVLHDVSRLEVLGVEQLLLRIDIDAPAKVPVEPLPIRMVRVRQIGDGLS